MNAAAQLSMFEPEGAEALALLNAHVREAQRHFAAEVRFELLMMPGAARRAEAMAEEATKAALVLAVLLDLEAEAGL